MKNTTNMKNPVKFMNKRGGPIFIYHVYDNSYMRIDLLDSSESSLHNIPYHSHIVIKDVILINDDIIPSETIIEMKLNKNHICIN